MIATKKSVLLEDRNEAGPGSNVERIEVNLHTSSPECTAKDT
jgi:hypothetical protein